MPTPRILIFAGSTRTGSYNKQLARAATEAVRAAGAEASYVDHVPEDSQRYLSSAAQAGRRAAQAGAGHLLLTHLLPGTDPAAARGAATNNYAGRVGVAAPGLVLDLQ